MNATRILAVALLTAAVTVPALPAAANEDDVIREGSCTGRADWKVKASPEDGRIEVEGEIDSNRNGQTWRWRLVHNGSVSDRGTRTTRGASGSFEVRRVVVNLRGTDKLVFRARNAASGETCRGVVNF
ncbi:MAG TPA: hypothetical protein VFG72_02695 [Marmoricola sp.]|nr:hypothetical protein [Marmoricola sp.]